MRKNIISLFQKFLTKEQIIFEEKDMINYAHDSTEDFIFLPDLVLIPKNTNEISQIMKICNKHAIPVVTRGTGTGLSGGALASNGGIILSMECFNKILEINEENFYVTVEPYVLNYDLQVAVSKKGLFYPPDPANYKFCSIGGNIAESSGGPKAVKYGTTKDYVLSLEIVLADGSIITTGKNIIKDVAGYNLTQLFVGSEGTLGIITKATLKLLPKITHKTLLLASFSSIESAGKAVNKIFHAGIIPSSLEFMERNALLVSKKHFNIEFPPIFDSTQAHLIIELDGNYEEIIKKEKQQLVSLLQTCENIEEVLFADTKEKEEELWKLRRHTGIAVMENYIFKEEDVSVPRSNIPKAVSFISDWAKKYGYAFTCFGHIGDGNLHVNILKGNASEEIWNHELKKHLIELFSYVCHELEGSVTGEHGIGLTQKDFLPIMLDQTTIELMKGIKKLFDPNNILNPGKIFN